MTEPAGERVEREKQLRAQIAEEFPDWSVKYLVGYGFEALPRDTPIIHSTSAEELLEKLRKQREAETGDDGG